MDPEGVICSRASFLQLSLPALPPKFVPQTQPHLATFEQSLQDPHHLQAPCSRVTSLTLQKHQLQASPKNDWQITCWMCFLCHFFFMSPCTAFLLPMTDWLKASQIWSWWPCKIFQDLQTLDVFFGNFGWRMLEHHCSTQESSPISSHRESSTKTLSHHRKHRI